MKIKILVCCIVLLLTVQSVLFGQYAGESSSDHRRTFTNPNPHQPVSIDASKLEQTSEVRNIILMIGDGMGLTHVSAGMTANRGRLNLGYFKVIGLQKTQASNKYVTDSAASGTAIATGVKTRVKRIGLDPDDTAKQSILEIAESNGLATGLIATSSVTHATPASFAAHQRHREMQGAIAWDLVKSGVDVLIGGGKLFFAKRWDGFNLIDSLKQRHYTIHESLESVKANASMPLAALLADEGLPAVQGRGDMLPRATRKALQILDQSDTGFFLMVEGSQIDWASHDNNAERVVLETLDFDQALGEVLQFAAKDGNTLVIVTADHETGGLAVEKGNVDKGMVRLDFTSDDHTGTMVPVFAVGPKAELFQGIYENTEIFHKMKEAFGF